MFKTFKMFIRFFVKYFIRFHNRSFVFGIKGLFPDSKFFFWYRSFVSNLLKQFRFKPSFPNFYWYSNLELRFQNRTFFSKTWTFILKTKLRIWVVKTSWKWRKAAIPEIKLQFLKRSFSSGNKALNLNWNSSLETKLRFLKRSFDFRNKNSILERRIRFWKHRIYWGNK